MSGTYELWQCVERTGTNATSRRWMVWEIGPISTHEEWFETEAEARIYIADAEAEWKGVYPTLCINPETCRGHTSCPRPYSCSE